MPEGQREAALRGGTVPLCCGGVATRLTETELSVMKQKDILLDKRVSVRGMGAALGNAFLAAAVARLFWRRRAIKRLFEINRM